MGSNLAELLANDPTIAPTKIDGRSNLAELLGETGQPSGQANQIIQPRQNKKQPLAVGGLPADTSMRFVMGSEMPKPEPTKKPLDVVKDVILGNVNRFAGGLREASKPIPPTEEPSLGGFMGSEAEKYEAGGIPETSLYQGAKEAFVSPERAKEPLNVVETAKKTGVSAGVGAGLGLALPEITAGVGRGVMALPFPQAKVAGASIMGVGQAMKPAGILGRALLGVEGAISGAGAELAKETYKQTLGGGLGEEVAGFVGGGAIVPVGEKLVRFAGSKAGKAYSIFKAGGERAGFVDPTDLPQGFKDAVYKNAEEVHKSISKGLELERDTAKEAFDNVMNVAQQKHDAIIAEATERAKTVADPKAAENIMLAGNQQASEILTKGKVLSGNIMKGYTDRRKTLEKIYQDTVTEIKSEKEGIIAVAKGLAPEEKTLDKIGGGIREVIKNYKSGAKERLDEMYGEHLVRRDQFVKELQDEGVTLKDIPEFNDLRKEIVTLLHKKTEAGEAKVTETGLRDSLEKILKGLSPRMKGGNAKPVAMPEEKLDPLISGELTPTITPDVKKISTKGGKRLVPPTFEAIDDVRRKLAKVAFGKGEKEVTGYDALGKELAKKYYWKISEVQNKYIDLKEPDLQVHLQGLYADYKEEVSPFANKFGKAGIGVAQFDPELHTTDAKDLPKLFFKSSESLKQLIRMSTPDDIGRIKELAKGYISKSLEGKNPAIANKWVNNNEQWIKDLGLDSEIEGYLGKLKISGEKIEALKPKLRETKAEAGQFSEEKARILAGKTEMEAGEEAKTVLMKEGKKVEKALGEEAKRIMSAGTEKAKSVLVEAEKSESANALANADRLYKSILADKAPVSALTKIITGDKPHKNIPLLIDKLKADPTAQATLVDAIYALPPNAVKMAWRKGDLKEAIIRNNAIPDKDVILLNQWVNKELLKKKDISWWQDFIISGLQGGVSAFMAEKGIGTKKLIKKTEQLEK